MARRDVSSGAWIDDIVGSEVKRLEAEPLIPTHLGSWRVHSLLGEGGQGKVYRAQRDCDGITQTAAVKVLARPITADAVLARFQRERTILAGLDHPNVARFLVAERTASGRPLLVMDYVEGQPIDAYCDQERLGLQERLTLFATVARAVHAVHRYGVIHRDIKPSNLLVTRDGTPKLLDFGVAKLMGTSEATALTTTLAPFTPDYASPEQVLGDPITTAVDVYALGVLLYRLLTGHLPYRAQGRTPQEHGRSIQRNEPVLPSVHVAGGPTTEGEGAGITPRDLRGDLDTIVARAMHGDPQRRYDSAMALADDIQRYLEGRLVLARPDTVGYRLGKVARRHRWALLALTLMVTAIVLIVAFYTLRLRDERDRANTVEGALQQLLASADANGPVLSGDGVAGLDLDALGGPSAIQNRLLELLTQDPPGVLDNEPTVIAMIVAAREAARALESQPRAQARLRETLGQVLRSYRRHPEAREQLEQALAIRRTVGEADAVADTLHTLAVVAMEQDDLKAAGAYLAESVAIRLEIHGEDSLPVAASRQQLAELDWMQGDFESARQTIEGVLALRRRISPNDLLSRAGALDVQGAIQMSQGESVSAVAVFREALGLRRDALGDRHTKVAENWNNLGFVLRARGKQTGNMADLEAAADAIRQALAIHLDVLGGKTMDTVIGWLNLGIIQRYQERPVDSLATCQMALDLALEIGDETHINVPPIYHCIGRAHMEVGNFVGAETAYRDVVRLTRNRVQDDPTRQGELAVPLRRLGMLLIDAGRRGEAVPFLRESDAIRPSSKTACALAEVLVSMGNVVAARAYQERCLS